MKLAHSKSQFFFLLFKCDYIPSNSSSNFLLSTLGDKCVLYSFDSVDIIVDE